MTHNPTTTVTFDGSTTQAHAIQTWLNTGTYTKPALSTRDIRTAMVDTQGKVLVGKYTRPAKIELKRGDTLQKKSKDTFILIRTESPTS